MNTKLFNRCFSSVTAIAISICSMSFNTVFCEDAEKIPYTVTFDLDGGVCEDTEFPKLSVSEGYIVTIPDAELVKEGYDFTGWTYNNYIVYEAGDTFQVGTEDIVLVPVWVDLSDKTTYDLMYDGDGGEIIGTLNERSCLAGRLHLIPKYQFQKEGFEQFGWTDGEHTFRMGEKMIMPAHDVTLSPVWCQIHNIYYESGDVDNLIGGTSITFEKTATQSFELADNTRLARKGYNLVGWKSDVDGQEYLTNATFTMPDSDVHFTAVWKPISYNVKFSASTKESVKVKASYGESLIVPECEFTKDGYVFGGWTYKGKTYDAGDRFEIPALLRGETITFGCKWIKESEVSTEQINCFSLIEAKNAYQRGEGTLEEVHRQYDFILCK
ncbi:MAG: InlB B-repeat-containing protein [Oscillospiraceae bacterium]|nr:InlB B-repeat-containing protein [Oscillospiraceae bacterium]